MRIGLVALVAAAGLVAFLSVRPNQPWILWLTALLIGLAADGIVRANPSFQSDSFLSRLAPALLPAITVLGIGYFLDEATSGYARPVGGALGGFVAGFIVYGEFRTVDFDSRLYGTMRLVLAIASYLVAFALFTIIFTRNDDVRLSALLVGVVSMALAVELLRESRLLGLSSLMVGLAIGISLAEFRIVLYYFPLDGLLAGALLIIAFYLATGLVHHLLDHDLEVATMAEYLLVGSVGTAAVVIARVFV